MPKPSGKCFAKNCEDCNWYGEMWMEKLDENGNPTGIKGLRKVCKFETLFDFLHRLAGNFDGLQGAVNMSVNKVDRFGKACANAFQAIHQNLEDKSKPPKRIN